MAEHPGSLPPGMPEISISRTSTESRASGNSKKDEKQAPSEKQEGTKPSPKLHTSGSWSPYRRFGPKSDTWKQRSQTPGLEWHIKWTQDCFPSGRVLIIDYISNEANLTTAAASPTPKRHVTVAAQEFEDLRSLKSFYCNQKRVHGAALRVIHVQNATWATRFLLRKFNIDHPSEIVGMQGFSKWARYEKPRQRNGRPFPNGRSWREQTDPWRNVSRTAFGLDYLKTFHTEPPNNRKRKTVFGDKPIDAQMMHLNAYEDGRSPFGYDVSVQRMSCYIQRNLGAPRHLSPEENFKNPYLKHSPNGHFKKGETEKVDLSYLDNSSTIIVFETSASILMEDCLVQPRNEFENRWRRLSFYLKKEDVLNDSRLAAQCTNMILNDVFHGLAVVWQDFLSVGADHVNILEDKIYENPADESRAPELWKNQAAWLKVDKVMYIHQDLVKEMQGHLHQLSDVDSEDEPQQIEWLSGIPAEYERLAHNVQEDLVQPTTNLSDLMYKSVGIRDSRQSLQLGLSMWRLSWITFIFLPLTFIVSFFGMNVNIFGGEGGGGLPNVGWYFLAAVSLMIMVLFLWYCVKHSLQRRRQTPYQRGSYEHLFSDLENEYPLLWSSAGAAADVEPIGFFNTLRWRLIRRWFSPERTINKQTYTGIGYDVNGADFDSWSRFKRYLLCRWLPEIRMRPKSDDRVSIVEMGEIETDAEFGNITASAPPSLHYEAGTINQLAKMTTPVAIADAEPMAVQQISTYGLRPLSVQPRRRSSDAGSAGTASGRYSEERPGSRGSSGIMIEERNFSDSESDAEGMPQGSEGPGDRDKTGPWR